MDLSLPHPMIPDERKCALAKIAVAFGPETQQSEPIKSALFNKKNESIARQQRSAQRPCSKTVRVLPDMGNNGPKNMCTANLYDKRHLFGERGRPPAGGRVRIWDLSASERWGLK